MTMPCSWYACVMGEVKPAAIVKSVSFTCWRMRGAEMPLGPTQCCAPPGISIDASPPVVPTLRMRTAASPCGSTTSQRPRSRLLRWKSSETKPDGPPPPCASVSNVWSALVLESPAWFTLVTR